MYIAIFNNVLNLFFVDCLLDSGIDTAVSIVGYRLSQVRVSVGSWYRC